jgi:hypothetical protein
VVRRGTSPTVDYRLDVAYDDYPYGASWSLYHSLTKLPVSGFNDAKFGYLSSQSVGLVRLPACDPSFRRQLVILDFIGDGKCCDYGSGSVVAYATAGDSDVLVTSGNSVPDTSATKSMKNVSCIVSQMASASLDSICRDDSRPFQRTIHYPLSTV